MLGRAPDDRGGVRAREITLRKKDGTPAVFLESSRAVWDAAGKLIRYQGTLIDVTERRKLERQVLQQEEFRRHLLESFPDLILVVDLDERYTFVSSRVRDLLGYQPEDLLGKKISETEDHSPELAAVYHDVVSGIRIFGSAEYGARHRDGSWRTMRASASQLFDADAKLGGVIVSVRDITMEKKLEQQIVQSERLAAMGAMIGGVAHELNNPLTSILGVSELLQDSQTTDVGAQADRDTTAAGPPRCRDCSQPDLFLAGRRRPGRLRSIWERSSNARSTCTPIRCARTTSPWTFCANRGCPMWKAIPHQLMQVFLNLILNAEQAIREARDRGTLRIRLGNNGDSVWASFQDDGPGIPSRHVAQHLRSVLHDQAAGARNRART